MTFKAPLLSLSLAFFCPLPGHTAAPGAMAKAWGSYMGTFQTPGQAPFVQSLGLNLDKPENLSTFFRLMEHAQLSPTTLAAAPAAADQASALQKAIGSYAIGLAIETTNGEAMRHADAVELWAMQQKFDDLSALKGLVPAQQRESVLRGHETTTLLLAQRQMLPSPEAAHTRAFTDEVTRRLEAVKKQWDDKRASDAESSAIVAADGSTGKTARSQLRPAGSLVGGTAESGPWIGFFRDGISYNAALSPSGKIVATIRTGATGAGSTRDMNEQELAAFMSAAEASLNSHADGNLVANFRAIAAKRGAKQIILGYMEGDKTVLALDKPASGESYTLTLFRSGILVGTTKSRIMNDQELDAFMAVAEEALRWHAETDLSARAFKAIAAQRSRR